MFISSCLLTVHGQVALGIKEVHDNPVKFLFEIAAFTVIGYNLYKKNHKTVFALMVSGLFFVLYRPSDQGDDTLADNFFKLRQVALLDRRFQTCTEPLNQFVWNTLNARRENEENPLRALEQEQRNLLDALLEQEENSLFPPQ